MMFPVGKKKRKPKGHSSPKLAPKTAENVIPPDESVQPYIIPSAPANGACASESPGTATPRELKEV